MKWVISHWKVAVFADAGRGARVAKRLRCTGLDHSRAPVLQKRADQPPANTMSDREGPARGSQIRIHQASTIAVKHVIWKSIVRDHVIELASRLVVPAAPTRRCVDADNCTLIDAREKTLRIVPIDPEQLEIVAYAISRRSSHCHRRKRQPLPSTASAPA